MIPRLYARRIFDSGQLRAALSSICHGCCELRNLRLQSSGDLGYVFLLFTDRDDLDADLVSLIYRHRWQIELFFKWIKGILGCRH